MAGPYILDFCHSEASSTSTATNPTVAVPAGTTILIWAYDASSTPASGTVTDTKGNTYTRITFQVVNNVAANGAIVVFYAHSVTALTTSDTITYTNSTSSFLYFDAAYLVGLVSGDTLNASVTAGAFGNSTTPSVTSGSPGANDVMLIASTTNLTANFYFGNWLPCFNIADLLDEPGAPLGSLWYGHTAVTFAPAGTPSGPWAAVIVGFNLGSRDPNLVNLLTEYGTSTTCTLDVPTTIPAGSLILLDGWSGAPTPNTAGVSDTQGNIYHLITAEPVNGNALVDGNEMYWYCYNCNQLTSSDVITVFDPAGDGLAFELHYSTYITGSEDPLDRNVTTHAVGNGANQVVVSGAPTQLNELIYGSMGNSGVGAAGQAATVQAAGFTQFNLYFSQGYMINSTLAPITYNPTGETSGVWGGAVFGFRSSPYSYTRPPGEVVRGGAFGINAWPNRRAKDVNRGGKLLRNTLQFGRVSSVQAGKVVEGNFWFSTTLTSLTAFCGAAVEKAITLSRSVAAQIEKLSGLVASAARQVETIASLKRSQASADEYATSSITHVVPAAESLIGMKVERIAADEYLPSLKLSVAAADESLLSLKDANAADNEYLATLKRNAPAQGESATSLKGSSLANDEGLLALKAAAPGQDELILGLVSKTPALVEVKGLAVAVASAMLQAELLSAQKANTASMAELKGLAMLTLSAAMQAEIVTSQKGSYSSADESTLTLKRNAAEALEIILGDKRAGGAGVETAASLLRQHGVADELLLKALSARLAAGELATKALMTGTAQAETAANLLGRVTFADESLHGMAAGAVAGGEYAIKLTAHTASFAELLGVTLTFFNSIAPIELFSQILGHSGVSAESSTQSVAHLKVGEEILLRATANCSTNAEKVTALRDLAIVTAETVAPLIRSSLATGEVAHGLVRSSVEAAELSSALKYLSPPYAETSAQIKVHSAVVSEIAAILRRQAAAASETLLASQLVSAVTVEEVGTVQAFAINAATLLELIATKLAAMSRTFDSPVVDADAFDSSIVNASAFDASVVIAPARDDP